MDIPPSGTRLNERWDPTQHEMHALSLPPIFLRLCFLLSVTKVTVKVASHSLFGKVRHLTVSTDPSYLPTTRIRRPCQTYDCSRPLFPVHVPSRVVLGPMRSILPKLQ